MATSKHTGPELRELGTWQIVHTSHKKSRESQDLSTPEDWALIGVGSPEGD